MNLNRILSRLRHDGHINDEEYKAFIEMIRRKQPRTKFCPCINDEIDRNGNRKISISFKDYYCQYCGKTFKIEEILNKEECPNCYARVI